MDIESSQQGLKKPGTHGYLSIRSSPRYMGVSENSVPLNPMVLLIIIPIKWLFHWEYTLFSDKPIFKWPFEVYHSQRPGLG
jgi:hypothetical protein